jgi:uncharacterized protein YqeY
MSEPSGTAAAIKAAMKDAMKSRARERLATIRLIQSEFKRVEVDERIKLDEARVLAILDKMVKQRRDSRPSTKTPDAPNSPPRKRPRSP